MYRITPVQSDDAVAERLLTIVVDKLNRAFSKSNTTVKAKLGKLAGELIRATPEYQSLLGGKLYHELGVVDASPAIESVIRAIQASMLVESRVVKRSKSNLSGGMTISLLRKDYSEVLNAEGASFISEGKHEIPWLKWLTLGGDQILVAEYHFQSGFPQRSRTGDGVMVRGGTWRVPPEFSGDRDSNWLTRAIGQASLGIVDILVKELG